MRDFMSRNKTASTKEKLGKALKQNRRIPLFAIARTNRRVTVNRMRRHWRNQKLKLKE